MHFPTHETRLITVGFWGLLPFGTTSTEVFVGAARDCENIAMALPSVKNASL